MKINRGTYILTLILLILSTQNSAQVKKLYAIASPDKHTNFDLGISSNRKLMYSMSYFGQKVVTWSALGFEMKGIDTAEKTGIKNKAQQSHRGKFAWPIGENDTITNNYNEIKLSCTIPALQYNFIARVFDGSVAFRYEIPQQSASGNDTIGDEYTKFNFSEPYTIYQYSQESVFTPLDLNKFTKTCDLPATLANGKLFISIGEADNTGYTKAELKSGSQPNSLAIALVRDSVIKIDFPFQSPWRTISVSKTAIGLHDYSELFLKLTPPAASAVPGWIKPGKLIRAQLNTQSGLDCIDFAAKYNFQYIMFDAGWYGAEFQTTSHPTQVIPQIDMPKIIQHGKEKNIGVILYVNYVGLKAKLDTILPLYKSWGIKGLKFGFVDALTHNGLTWLVSAMKKVNNDGFILDIHDNYKPTGLSRRYPALLTQEGIRGDENNPDAFHTATLPFTRFLAGAADFTFCYPNSKKSFAKNLKVSKAQQLALTVIYFSPLQSVFWYGEPNDYTNEKEIEFFKYVPTVWDESHYLAGDIGKNISVARRKGTAWFVGNAAGLQDWKSNIHLNFLTKGKSYTATIYEDNGEGSITKRSKKIKKGDVFPFFIKAKEGQAIIIRSRAVEILCELQIFSRMHHYISCKTNFLNLVYDKK